MKRLTRRANHPILYRNLRMAASVLLVFMIGFGSILTVSTEARDICVWVDESAVSVDV